MISSLSQPDGVSVSRYSVANSQSSLIHSVQPSDCTSAGFVLGGVTMKMMDEVAGIVAFRHCKSNVVTASIGKFLVVLGKENKTSIAGNNSLSTLTSYNVHDCVCSCGQLELCYGCFRKEGGMIIYFKGTIIILVNQKKNFVISL